MKYQIASDLNRNGMSLECLNDGGKVAFEIFYSDNDKKFTVETLYGPVNIVDINNAMFIAESRLPSIHDNYITSIEKLKRSIRDTISRINSESENMSTKEYLIAMESWIEDCDGYYQNIGKNDEIGIMDIAIDAIQAGLIYE